MPNIFNPKKFKINPPIARTIVLNTAYQAIDTENAAVITINISSIANFSLIGGTTNTANIIIGPTSGVVTGIGTTVCNYSNSVTGTISFGLNMNSVITTSHTVALPKGWYFAVRQTQGTVEIVSAFDERVD